MIFRQFLVTAVGVVVFVTAASSLFAKAYYATEEEMIHRSETIAIVDIYKVEAVEVKGTHWTYHQRAHAIVQQTIKGTLPKKIQLYGDEDFDCAQIHFHPGRCLVFLGCDESKLVGTNWELSVRPIKGPQVEWYVPGKGLELSWQPLSTVIERINQKLSKFKER